MWGKDGSLGQDEGAQALPQINSPVHVFDIPLIYLEAIFYSFNKYCLGAQHCSRGYGYSGIVKYRAYETVTSTAENKKARE
jgi:hypothetical protein